MSGELNRWELAVWHREVVARMARLHLDPFAPDELEILQGYHAALMDAVAELNRRDPIDDDVCEGCRESPAMICWASTMTPLCRDCWREAWEIEQAIEMGGWQRTLFEEFE